MSDNILQAIDRLALAMENLTIATNVTQSQSQQAIICCDQMPSYYDQPESTIQVDEGDPPAPYPDWPAYKSELCQRAWTAVLRVQRAMFELYDQSDIGALLGLGLIALILAPISAPVAVLVAIVALLTGAAFEGTTPARKNNLEGIGDDVVCAIYNNINVNSAKSAVNSVIDGSTLDILSKQVLKLSYSITLLNAIYDQTLTIDPGVPTDCTDCLPPTPDLLRTQLTGAMLVVEVGTFIQAFSQTEGFGWRSRNPDDYVIFEFALPTANVPSWRISYECMPNTGEFPTTPIYHLDRWTGSAWATDRTKVFEQINDGNAHTRTELVNTVTLLQNTQYRIRLNTQIFQYRLWHRRIHVYPSDT